VMLDSACQRRDGQGTAKNLILWAFAGYTLATCALFIGFLA
jgi:hypothetical protein